MTMMSPVLSTDAMQSADRRTIEDYGLPGFTLMENAGRGAARKIKHSYYPIANQSVSLLVGKGNNGGDGLVVARELSEAGADVRVVLLAGEDELNGAPLQNLRILRRLADRSGGLRVEPFETVGDLEEHRSCDLFVDALLGTGLTDDLRSPIREIVDWLNGQDQPVVALDIPTGLDSDRGLIHGSAVRSDLTITMAARKSGQLINEGPGHCGRLHVVDIGTPRFILDDETTDDGCAQVVSDRAVRSWLPERSTDSHKYTVGMVLTLGGSPGLTGAPVMASEAAARAGAGAVVCGCPRSVQNVLAQKLTEVMTLGLPETKDGGLSPDALTYEPLQQRLTKARALLVGCGLGRDPASQSTVRQLLRRTDLPMVLDADGLNAMVEHTELLNNHADGRVILTPHEGEFRRLADADVDLDDRLRTAASYARRWNSVLLLKGFPGIVAAPNGRCFINTTGTPALTSAGTGDVLAGICAGLAAQGLSPVRAATAALRIGGAAADAYLDENDARGLMATDIISLLPRVLHQRF